MRLLFPFLLALSQPALLNAQRATGSTQSPDSVILRALAMANENRTADARVLVDSVLRVTQPTSPRHVEALFWKGKFAESEQIAEEAYKKIVLDFPLHRRAEESLILLANLEMMRGNRVLAQRYLDRIVVEHPYGSHRATASYWRARLFFEESEVERACAELGVAKSKLTAGDAELRTEIEFAARSCANVPTPTQTPAQRAAANAAAAGEGRSARAGGSAGGGSRGRQGQQVAGAARAGRGSNTGNAATTKQDTSGARRAEGETKGKGVAVVSQSGAMFSAQAAAFPSKENAEALVAALSSRGYQARLFGSAPPYRVRIGMFATRAEADSLVAELKTRRVSSDAFVVEAERR